VTAVRMARERGTIKIYGLSSSLHCKTVSLIENEQKFYFCTKYNGVTALRMARERGTIKIYGLSSSLHCKTVPLVENEQKFFTFVQNTMV
jgi:hypothetical protein